MPRTRKQTAQIHSMIHQITFGFDKHNTYIGLLSVSFVCYAFTSNIRHIFIDLFTGNPN